MAAPFIATDSGSPGFRNADKLGHRSAEIPGLVKFDFAILHTIAGLYNPTLGLLCLMAIGLAIVRKLTRLAFIVTLHLMAVLLIAYGFMALDRIGILDTLTQLFGIPDASYSTHSAAAMCGASFLMVHMRQSQLPVLCSVPIYLSLVLFQRYHSLADVLFTALLVLSPAIWCMLRAARARDMLIHPATES